MTKELLDLENIVAEAEVTRAVLMLTLTWKGKKVECVIKDGECGMATFIHGDGTCNLLHSDQRQVIFEEVKRRGLV